ncbi:MAG: hypothetical protein ACI9RV_003017, partial [Glaciecola sp.]
NTNISAIIAKAMSDIFGKLGHNTLLKNTVINPSRVFSLFVIAVTRENSREYNKEPYQTFFAQPTNGEKP